jgi:hypothetical protein
LLVNKAQASSLGLSPAASAGAVAGWTVGLAEAMLDDEPCAAGCEPLADGWLVLALHPAIARSNENKTTFILTRISETSFHKRLSRLTRVFAQAGFLHGPFQQATEMARKSCPNFVKQTVSLRWMNGIQRARKLTVCFTNKPDSPLNKTKGPRGVAQGIKNSYVSNKPRLVWF